MFAKVEMVTSWVEKVKYQIKERWNSFYFKECLMEIQ